MGLKAEAEHGLLTVGSLLFTILSLSLFNMKSLLFSGYQAERLGPFRWVSATFVPVFVASWAHDRKSLSTTGALTALLVGFILTLTNYSFLISLLVLFITSSRVIKYREGLKKEMTSGKRNWLEVLSSCGIVLLLSLLHLFDLGSADLPIDFRHQYRASWFGCAVLGCLSFSAGDTWASQMGSLLARSNPRLITNLCQVPRGTNGGITFSGLVCSFLGGLVIGAAYFAGIILSASSQDLQLAPNQLNVILVGGLGGLLGSIIDSILGASLQFSGQDTRTGKIVEVAGEDVIPISGKMILDNRSVNLVSSILTALLLPDVAMKMGL